MGIQKPCDSLRVAAMAFHPDAERTQAVAQEKSFEGVRIAAEQTMHFCNRSLPVFVLPADKNSAYRCAMAIQKLRGAVHYIIHAISVWLLQEGSSESVIRTDSQAVRLP